MIQFWLVHSFFQIGWENMGKSQKTWRKPTNYIIVNFKNFERPNAMLRQNAREEDLFPFDLLRFFRNSWRDSEFLEDFRAETGTTVNSMGIFTKPGLFKSSQVNHESDELATWMGNPSFNLNRQQGMLKLDVKLFIPDPSPRSVTPSDTCWTSAFESNSLWVWIVYPSPKLRVRLENQPFRKGNVSVSLGHHGFQGRKMLMLVWGSVSHFFLTFFF